MKLVTTEGTDLLDVTAVTATPEGLVIEGQIMGAMPMKALLRPAELRRGMRFARWRILVAVLGMIDSFSGTMFANEAEVLGAHPDRVVVGLSSIVDEDGAVVSSVRTSPCVGEVSPVYLQALAVPHRIHDARPDARIVAVEGGSGRFG